MKSLILIILSLLLFSCGDKPNSPTEQVGKLSITNFSDGDVENYQLARRLTKAPLDINAGLVKYSKDVKIIIENTGTAPIESLYVSTSNPNIVMSTDTIFIVPVSDQPVIDTIVDANGKIIEIVESTPPKIIHSIILNHGADFYSGDYVWPLLKYGSNVDTITFSGVSNGQRIEEKFTIGYDAIYLNLKKVDVSDPTIRALLYSRYMFADDISIVQPEMTYNGQSCKNHADDPSNLTEEFFPTVGDTTLTYHLSTIRDEYSSDIVVKSDCAIKQNVPLEYQ